MGVVIGETAEVERDVVLFHGVTLGGTEKTRKTAPTVRQGAFISAMLKFWGQLKLVLNKIGAKLSY